MDKRFSRMTESGTRLTFVVMLLFAAVTWVQVHWAAGLAELVLVGLLYLYYRQRTKRRAAEIRKYVENLAFSVDDASKKAIEAVRKLCADVGIPPLCETKFKMEDIDVLARHTLKDTATKTNIVRPTVEDVKTILAKTYYEGIVMKKVTEHG